MDLREVLDLKENELAPETIEDYEALFRKIIDGLLERKIRYSWLDQDAAQYFEHQQLVIELSKDDDKYNVSLKAAIEYRSKLESETEKDVYTKGWEEYNKGVDEIIKE